MRQHRTTESDTTNESSDRSLVRLALKWVVGIGLTLWLLRTFVLAPYSVPSNSMTPAIEPGSTIVVDLLSYRFGDPERGDIVLFGTPEPGRNDLGGNLVKRIVALPGDRIRMTDSGIRVRNRTEGIDTLYRSDPPRQIFPLLATGDAFTLPCVDCTVTLEPRDVPRWGPLIRREGSTIEVRNGIIFIDGNPTTRYRFRSDHYLPLGDNPTNSRDGRSFGPIRRELIIGRKL